jgi:hypothetical protein
MPGKLQPAWLANLDKNRSGDDAKQESISPQARDMNVVAKNPFLMRAALSSGHPAEVHRDPPIRRCVHVRFPCLDQSGHVRRAIRQRH